MNRYINITDMDPKMVEQMRVLPVYLACPYCRGSGFKVVKIERLGLEVFDTLIPGTMVTARPCEECLPWAPGITYGLCAS